MSIRQPLSFQQMYYIEHTLWSRNFDADSVEKLDVKFGDTIIFHFDLIYSIFKTKTSKLKVDKNIIFDAINICLRMRQKIKQVYPYNDVYVVVHADRQALKRLVVVDEAVLQSLIDIIPDFALVVDKDDSDLKQFNINKYKHIIYGKCSGLKSIYSPENYQVWLLLNGKLYITK